MTTLKGGGDEGMAVVHSHPRGAAEKTKILPIGSGGMQACIILLKIFRKLVSRERVG
jgi:hypothetical protein